jgi:hypothetical protein
MVCVTGRRQVLVSPRGHTSRQAGLATVRDPVHIMSRSKVNQSLGEATDISRGQDRVSGRRPRWAELNLRVPAGTSESRPCSTAPAGANTVSADYRGLRFARPGLISDVPSGLWQGELRARPCARRPASSARTFSQVAARVGSRRSRSARAPNFAIGSPGTAHSTFRAAFRVFHVFRGCLRSRCSTLRVPHSAFV